jgi:hypothetical protein
MKMSNSSAASAATIARARTKINNQRRKTGLLGQSGVRNPG